MPHARRPRPRETVPAVVPRTGERPCPVCATRMTVHEKLGVELDVCADHGIWLDHGELDTILFARSRADGIVQRARLRRLRREMAEGRAPGWWGVLLQ